MDFLFNLFIIIADQLMLFVINVLVARHVGEKLFGDFSVATSSLLLIATIVTLGIDAIVAYYFPKLFVRRQFDQLAQLARSIRKFLEPIHLTIFSLGLLLALAIIALSMAFEKLQIFELNHPLFLFFWGASAISLYNIFVQLFRSVGYMRTGISLSLLQTVIYFVLAIIIYQNYRKIIPPQYIHFFPHAMLIGFLASYFITDTVCFWLFNRISRPFLDKIKSLPIDTPFEWRQKIYGYMVQNLNIYIFSTIPLLAIEWLGQNEKSVGLFAAVISIISLAFIGIRPLGILIAPEISAALAEPKQKLIQTMRSSLLLCFGIATIITIIFALFAKQILLLYQAKFIMALPYLYWCLITIITYSVSMPLSRMIQYSEYGDKLGAKLTIIFIIVQVITSAILISQFGLVGAIICYVGVNVCYTLAMTIITIYLFKHHDPKNYEAMA